MGRRRPILGFRAKERFPHMRNLKSASTATDCDSQEARKWRLTDLARQCVFCGSDQVEAVQGARGESSHHPQHRGMPRLFG